MSVLRLTDCCFKVSIHPSIHRTAVLVIDFDSRERDLSVHLLPVCALVQVLGIRILYQSPGEITCNTEVAWIIGTLVNFNIVCRRKCGREWLFVSLRDTQRTGDLSTLRLRLQRVCMRGIGCPRWETLVRELWWFSEKFKVKSLKCFFVIYLEKITFVFVSAVGFLTWWTKMICKNTKLCDIH